MPRIRIRKVGAGELAARRTFLEDMVEDDCDPLKGIDREKQFDAPGGLGGPLGEGGDPFPDPSDVLFRHRHPDLMEEVADQLRRVVHASVFEVVKAESAIFASKRVVEPEVGGGDEPFTRLDIGGGVEAVPSHTFQDVVLQARPSRQNLIRDEVRSRCRKRRFRQAGQPSVHQR